MHARIAAPLLILAAPVAAQGAPGQISFAQTTFAFPGSASFHSLFHVAAADANGDGDLDVAVTYGKTIATYLGGGDGSFGGPVVTTPPGLGAGAVAVGDVDGNGCADFLVMEIAAHVLAGNCDGSYSPTQTLGVPISQLSNDGELADLDGDGDLDAIVNTYDLGVGYLLVYLGQGDASFVAWQAQAAGNHAYVVRGDVNEDGREDVFALGGAASLQYGTASGSLCCKFDLTTLGLVGAVTVADFDSDERPDVVTSGSTSSGFIGLATYPNSSTGDFSSVIESAVLVGGVGDGTLLAADFDLDGRMDVGGRTGGFGSYSIAVARGAGDGSFELAYANGVSGGANQAATGDFDGDGRMDIAVTHWQVPRVSILLNTTVPSAWVDLGHALAGSSGLPLLSGTGALTAGAITTLDLLHAAPSSPTVLVAGGSQLALPILGGVLVPSPDVLVFGLATSAQGELAHAFAWPGGIPTGASLYFQAWTADAAAPQGWSASNGLAATVP